MATPICRVPEEAKPAELTLYFIERVATRTARSMRDGLPLVEDRAGLSTGPLLASGRPGGPFCPLRRRELKQRLGRRESAQCSRLRCEAVCIAGRVPPVFFVCKRIEIGPNCLIDVHAQGSAEPFRHSRDIRQPQIV